ncbi:MAG TPA: STAS domain-containing protein [Bryobacteraceae bacterium]|nr:STAS domain-containing protein [Bryobacteraceae bacterium]
MLLQIEERQIEPGIAGIDLTGRFALGRESQRVETIVDELVKAGRTRAILNLTGVTYIDSAGIGLVALAAGRLKEAGGRLVAVAPDGRVLDMLKITQVNRIVTVCGTPQEAVDAFSKE